MCEHHLLACGSRPSVAKVTTVVCVVAIVDEEHVIVSAREFCELRCELGCHESVTRSFVHREDGQQRMVSRRACMFVYCICARNGLVVHVSL